MPVYYRDKLKCQCATEVSEVCVCVCVQPMPSRELWQWIHYNYGEELGLTSSDDDYMPPPHFEHLQEKLKPEDDSLNQKVGMVCACGTVRFYVSQKVGMVCACGTVRLYISLKVGVVWSCQVLC